MPKVSVIVPVYNAESWIKRCLDSIIGQTFSDFEVILINDGSEDSSLDILEAYAAKDNRFRVISQGNQGPSTARNTGIDNASGDYIYFVDADDYIRNDAIEKLYTAAVNSGAEVTICGLYYVKDGLPKEHKIAYEPGVYEGERAKKIALDLLNNHSHLYLPPYSAIRMIQREVLEDPCLRYAEGIMRSEDYLFTTELHFRIDKLCLITDEPLYYYIDNDDSITNTYVKNYWQMVRKINEILLSKLTENINIKKGLDIVLIYRSLIAFNNAARAELKETFAADVDEILQDPTLLAAIDSLSFAEGFKRFKAYYLLMRLRLKGLVKFRYYRKYSKNRKDS